jgi:hypothetical protein
MQPRLRCDARKPAWRPYVRLGFERLPNDRTLLIWNVSERDRSSLTPQMVRRYIREGELLSDNAAGKLGL